MAEIKIQKKKTSFWPWLLILLIVVIVVWLVTQKTNESKEVALLNGADTTKNQPEVVSPPSAINEVNALNNFVSANDAAQNTYEYVKQGLHHLETSLNAVVDEKNLTAPDVKAQSDSLASFVSGMEKSELRQTYNVRAAFLAASNILTRLVNDSYSDLKVNADGLKQTALSIDGTKSLKEQSDKIKNFFGNASGILHEIIMREV